MVSIMNHVADIHEGHGEKFERCQHAELGKREWIKKGSKAYEALEKVVKGHLLRNDIKKLSPAQQTSGLESYHRVVCFFAPKFLHFFHDSMEARLFLSAMHFNENSLRVQARTSEGTPQFRISYPKARKGQGIAKEVKTNATYGYVDELSKQLLLKRIHLTTRSVALEDRRRQDHPRPGPITQSYTTPRRSKEDIVRTHVSRFK